MAERFFNKFIKLLRKEKKETMRFRGIANVMQFLRERSRIIRPNNQKVNEWVDSYVNECVLQGTPVNILTQFCLSKSLERRLELQGGSFVPTKKERLIFEREIPAIANAFFDNGLRVNWWLTFNRSFLDYGRLDAGIENQYKAMIGLLTGALISQGFFQVLDWEDDVLGKRPEPNEEILRSPDAFISEEAFGIAVERQRSFASRAGIETTDDILRKNAMIEIAYEAEEGRLLNGVDSPFGNCILAPAELGERYDFFTIFAKDLKKRIVAVLPAYPWRLKSEE